MMTYNMAASRILVASLDVAFEGERFDEYAILNKPKLTLEFLDSRKGPQRVCVAHWLRWAVTAGLIVRDPDKPAWFRVLPAARPSRGTLRHDSPLSNSH
jgi:hypothetical protein